MILDYNYDKRQRRLDVSYIDKIGAKKLLQFNVNRFRTFYKTPTGPFMTWDGARCDACWTEKPSKFDLKYYFKQLGDAHKHLLQGKTFPKVYTFDIETWVPEDDEFPDPAQGKFPITTISIVSPELNCIVLSTRDLTQDEQQWVSDQFDSYLDNTDFFKELKLQNKPAFKYMKFKNEQDMLNFFLKNIVAKAPILTGWNCIFFDWQYIVNRIKNYFPYISLKSCSCTGEMEMKTYTDIRDNKITLPMPQHTLIIDMMQVIKDEDKVVMPIKESLSLDYIANESMGINKIEYNGRLQDLYNNDYPRYVYYNAIDSILVQLINYRFKTLDHIYMYSLYCEEKIGKCFSKIAVTESLVFQDFYERDMKIVYEPNENPERGRLIGAYVKIPIPGLWEYVCCNDFASLYPSTIRTCNLSFENYIGSYYDDEKLKPYQNNTSYIVIGPNVFHNAGTAKKPELGRLIGTFLNDEYLERFRHDPNYFVSVNGSVYRNDKDYSFRRIQAKLKSNRDFSKYLGKRMEATVVWDITHYLNGTKLEHRDYDKEMQEAILKVGLDAASTDDLYKYSFDELKAFKHELEKEITYYSCHEQAMKLLMNSMYGGSSHQSFYWFNMALANDITGESRNLIHKMEQHIPEWYREHWVESTDLHAKLGIEVDPDQAKQALEDATLITAEQDPDAYHKRSFVTVVYGDTDSLYISYNQLLKSIKGYEDLSVAQKRDIIVGINTKFMDAHNREYIANYYDTRFGKSVHNFELETLNRAGVWGDVKKRYAQILLWKEGDYFDLDNLKLKVKGLEVVKASFPKLSRKILGDLFHFMLSNAGDPMLIQKLNIEMMKKRDLWETADIEKISGSIKVNGYSKCVKDDTGNCPIYNVFDPKTNEPLRTIPWNVRALATYNQIRNYHSLMGEPIYGGLVKWYIIKESVKDKKAQTRYFAYQAANLPKWSQQYAPIDRATMFQQTVLDPINRILEANKMPLLSRDGSLQVSLF